MNGERRTVAGGQLLWEVADGIGSVVLNRPEKANALPFETVVALAELLENVSGDPAVRVVTITGTGTTFCGGPDIVRLSGPGQPGDRSMGDGARRTRLGWQRLVKSVLDCEKPVIAALNGAAAGAAVQLVLACDLVVAADNARLVELFVRRGIAPDAGAAYLVTRLVGPQRAKRIFFFGEDINAADALAWGLVTEVVTPDELPPTVATWARRLANGPTKALGVTKLLTNRALDSDRDTAFLEETYLQEMLTSLTEDATEGLRAFAEHRPPVFKGE